MNIDPTAWLLSLMLWKAPPSVLADRPRPGGTESVEDMESRYRSIAADLTAVAYDKNEKPLFKGSYARANTAALMLAVAFHESGFRKDVDKGPCAKGWCDGGQSACMMQLKIGTGTTPEGWSQKDLFTDRQKCFRAGLHRLQADCPKAAQKHRWTSYAAGHCGSISGQKRSEEIHNIAELFFNRTTRPLDHKVVLTSMLPIIFVTTDKPEYVSGIMW